jgi:hypothetical protein
MHSFTYEVEYDPTEFSYEDIYDIARESTQYTFESDDYDEGIAHFTFSDSDAVKAFESNMKAEGFRRGSDR